MTLYELIVKSSEAGVNLQDEKKGTLPAGHNGPYHDEHTPVRNTAHWTLLFLKSYKITDNSKFLGAANRAADYFLSKEARPMGATFWQRKCKNKDTCNGVIGQAWTIEALVEAGKVLERTELLDLAVDVFSMHPFDERMGIWKRMAPDGMILPHDVTFNHQLWFAASGALIADETGNEEIGKQVERFMDKLDTNFRIYSSGLIYHMLIFRYDWKQIIKDGIRIMKESKERKRKLAYKAVGYHLFNLYAFAMLRQQYPNDPFWNSKKFEKALSYAMDNQFKEKVSENIYGYPYNPPGFEMPLVIQEFGDDDVSEKKWWIQQQLDRCFDYNSWLMTKETEDPETHSARLYEATRLEDFEIN